MRERVACVHPATPAGGGVLHSVDPDGPASRAGLRARDLLFSSNGRPLRDVIDWLWEGDGASVEVEFARPPLDPYTRRTTVLTRVSGEAWGLEFEQPVFDGIRTCTNRCAFCFIEQLPAGLRSSLYVRDDDYRLSFLNGNFITLTNLDDADISRITEQRLSPLYVSLHAIDSETREALLGSREDRALRRFDELLGAAIGLHVQIVLVPEVNDGIELERTLNWLAGRKGVLSVGVVPLGYTSHQKRFTRSYGDPHRAAAVLDRLDPWRRASVERSGARWVHAADEFYLTAGRETPIAEHYDGFPQYENGIGLVRTFADELLHADPGPRSHPRHGADAVIATGSLFAPLLRRLMDDYGLARGVEVLAVDNTLFGGNVSVTGLLPGADLVRALRSVPATKRCIVPDIVFNDDHLTLDGLEAAHLSEATGRRVEILPATATGLLSGIL